MLQQTHSVPEQIVSVLMSAAKKQPHCSKIPIWVLFLELLSKAKEETSRE